MSHLSSVMWLWTGTVPGPAGGRSGERGLGEVDPAGRPDAGRAGQRARTSAAQPLQTSARDPDGTHVQHQLRDPRLQQQRRGETAERGWQIIACLELNSQINNLIYNMFYFTKISQVTLLNKYLNNALYYRDLY